MTAYELILCFTLSILVYVLLRLGEYMHKTRMQFDAYEGFRALTAAHLHYLNVQIHAQNDTIADKNKLIAELAANAEFGHCDWQSTPPTKEGVYCVAMPGFSWPCFDRVHVVAVFEHFGSLAVSFAPNATNLYVNGSAMKDALWRGPLKMPANPFPSQQVTE